MSNIHENDAMIPDERSRIKYQVKIHDLLLLTAAFALWLGMFPKQREQPIETSIIWIVIIALGTIGHLLYNSWLPWRGTVVLTSLVVPLIFLTVIAGISGAPESALMIFLMPIDYLLNQRDPHQTVSTALTFVCIAVLTAAHPFKPRLSNAIITAIGVSMWYVLANQCASRIVV